jgi:hypothetical protein
MANKSLYILSMMICYCHTMMAQGKELPVMNSRQPDTLIVSQLLLQKHNGLAADSVYRNFNEYYSSGLVLEYHKDRVFIAYERGPGIRTIPVAKNESSIVKVRGNILYNFSYRSYIDTPFAQQDLMQHLVQTNLNLLVKNRYPVKLTITNRSSNSAYFRNVTDVNMQFNQQQMLSNIKADLANRATAMVDKEGLEHAEKELTGLRSQYLQLQGWINNPAVLQQLVKEKESTLKDKLMNTVESKLAGAANRDSCDEEQIDSLRKKVSGKITAVSSLLDIKDQEARLTDSIKNKLTDFSKKDSSYIEKFNQKKQEIQKIREKIKLAETNARQLRKNVQDSINHLKNEINGLNNPEALYAFMDKKHISKDSLTKMQRILLSVNQVGIGRSWLDYSELTVKNVSLSGINVELNPGNFYVAAAAGKVNYRFRDFIYKNSNSSPDQPLYLVRAGAGKKEGNNIIATLYSGKKSVLNYTPGNSNSALQKVIGISLEARLMLDANNYLVAEVAKSSFTANSGIRPSSSQLFNKVFDLKTHTNEAYSIKLFSQHPATNTKLTAYYKKTGENFQSFNLYPININQDAWMVRVNQSLWKKRIILDAAIRKNDFVSPVAVASFSSQTIFKSFQATVRIPKYPFVSLGYYPSSQLTLGNGNTLTESQYNTFNALVSHNYRFHSTAMNSNASFTKFYNSSSDTGFIYYNASNISFTQSIFLSAFSLQSSVAAADQKELHLFTVEQQVTYQLSNNFSLTGGLKWNRLNHTKDLFGSTAAVNLFLKNIGTIQLNYDKTYLPGYNRTLVPVDMGRMSFYKIF